MLFTRRGHRCSSVTTPTGPNAPADKWRFAVADPSVMSDPDTQNLVDEGMDAAPDGFLNENVIQMLPREPQVGKCRICGDVLQLTKEHIPPRNSGNKQRHSSQSFDDWIAQDSIDMPESGAIRQGGIYGYTLCSPCNSFTGTHYGNEYKRWAASTLGAIGAMPGPAELDERPEPFGWMLELGSKETGGVKPGAFVRQVLSMMCSLSGTWDFATRHPEVLRIILGQSCEPLAEPLQLGAALYLGPRIRIMGPQLKIEPSSNSWRWLMEMAFPPFAFLLVLDSNLADPGRGLLMTDWVLHDPGEEKKFEGLFEVGFGWTPYPGDYRSKAAIEAGQ